MKRKIFSVIISMCMLVALVYMAIKPPVQTERFATAIESSSGVVN